MSDNLTRPADEHDPFEIDPRALDAEWIRQPALARAAGRREAEARDAHSRAKAALDVARAKARLAVRRAPGAYFLRDKPTVDEIEAAVEVSDDVQAAVAAVNAAKFELDVAGADVVAYVDRRKALEGLVDLLAMDYQTGREPSPRRGRAPEAEGVAYAPKARRTES